MSIIDVKITPIIDGNYLISKTNCNGDHTAATIFSDYELRVLYEKINQLNIQNLNIEKPKPIINNKTKELIEYINANRAEIDGFSAMLIGNVTDLIDLAVGQKNDWSKLNKSSYNSTLQSEQQKFFKIMARIVSHIRNVK